MHEESESQKRFATAQLVIDIEYDLNGENAEHIALLLRQAARHILDSGAVTEGSRVKINRCDVNVDVLDDDSQYLDEDDIAEFYYDRIENGAINLESLPRIIARRALMRPLDAKSMIWQQMIDLGMLENEEDEDDEDGGNDDFGDAASDVNGPSL